MEKLFIQNNDLDACFDYISNIYNSQKNKKPNCTEEIDRIEWAKYPYYNIYPFSIELDGVKRGKLYKNIPKNLCNVISYGFFKKKLMVVRFYNSMAKIGLEYILKYSMDQIIVYGYVDNKLKRVYCIIGDNNIPQYSLHLLYEDNNYARFYRHEYRYKNSLIHQIYERGFVFNKENNIGIIDVDYNIEYYENIVSKIIGTIHNHKIGKSVSHVVFSLK